VLPAPARLRRRDDFTLVVRRGRRAGRSTLVTHFLRADPATGDPARVGFVVGRAVGGSVVRHRTVRRLRHLVRDRLRQLPPGSMTVVRALPPAAAADSATLGRDLDATLDRLGVGSGAGVAGPGVAPAGPVTR
jgi:ribonuclease P protein component